MPAVEAMRLHSRSYAPTPPRLDGNASELAKIRLLSIGENVAVTVRAALIVTVQLRAGPAHSLADQPEKNEFDPLVVFACSVTCVPTLTSTEHEVPQLMPEGDVTVPVPFATMVNRACVGCGAAQ